MELFFMAYWHLYWVESDGMEDCFVVARNSRSAGHVECEMNGFEQSDLTITRILRLPEKVVKSYQKQESYKEKPWPYYVYGKEFFEELGAQFRTVDGKKQMLLEDVVYLVPEFVPTSISKEYSIGRKAYEELREIEGVAEIRSEEEDVWTPPQMTLIHMLGHCVVRCHQIEDYIANSFIFGVSDSPKRKNETISEQTRRWKRKTLGGMFKIVQENFEMEPLVEASFDLFRENRNRIIHGITTEERYDIETKWGQDELFSFLYFFDLHSLIVRKAFRASFYASIELGVHVFGDEKKIPKDFLKPEHKEEAATFFEFFKPKGVPPKGKENNKTLI